MFYFQSYFSLILTLKSWIEYKGLKDFQSYFSLILTATIDMEGASPFRTFNPTLVLFWPIRKLPLLNQGINFQSYFSLILTSASMNNDAARIILSILL